MNDDLMFEYLLQMGAMKPEQEEIRRKQAMVDALRQNSMTPGQGQMISGHYVPSGIAGAINQLGQAYFAKQGQANVDRAISNPDYDPNLPQGPNNMPGFNQRQQQALEKLRRRRMMEGAGAMPVEAEIDPLAAFRVPGRT